MIIMSALEVNRDWCVRTTAWDWKCGSRWFKHLSRRSFMNWQVGG